MCLIIAKPAGKPLIKELVKQSALDNPHGWGIAWVAGGILYSRKGMDMKQFITTADAIPLDSPAILHTRWATHGKKCTMNCHPFQLADDLVMMHNGVINIEQPNEKFSDTWHFAYHIVCPLLNRRRDLFNTDQLKELLGQAIGTGSKLAFLTKAGEIMLVNEDQGKWHEGLWISNGRSLTGSAWGTGQYGYSSYYDQGYQNWKSYRPQAKRLFETQKYDHTIPVNGGKSQDCYNCRSTTTRWVEIDSKKFCSFCNLEATARFEANGTVENVDAVSGSVGTALALLAADAKDDETWADTRARAAQAFAEAKEQEYLAGMYYG